MPPARSRAADAPEPSSPPPPQPSVAQHPPSPLRSHGCWTCRLRRKRCDRIRPICTNCAALDIACHDGAAKPTWMDGGARQRAMAASVKAAVKEGAGRRREKRAVGRDGGAAFVVSVQRDFEIGQRGSTTDDAALFDSGDAIDHTQDPSVSDSSNAAVLPPMTAPQPSSPLIPVTSTPSPPLGRGSEADFVAIFLDFVFPFLFPFYHPSLASTSRAWLLPFTQQNAAVRHSVLSLASFFVSLDLRDAYPVRRAPCQNAVWAEIVRHADGAFGMVRGEVERVARMPHGGGLLERVRLVETILQMLLFELFVGRAADWEAHLTPAVLLFDELFTGASKAQPDKPGLACVLDQLAWPRPAWTLLGRPLWNTDQAALRFFTAVLLYVDIISGTALGREPRLFRHLARIVGDVPRDEIAAPLDFSAFFGVQNWAVLAIGDIAALAAWKKQSAEAGLVVQVELRERVAQILNFLDQGFAELDAQSQPFGPAEQSPARLQPYYHPVGPDPSPVITRIWGFAARIYLATVVSGWSSALADQAGVQRTVAQVLRLARGITAVAQLRTLAWPVCVAGCVAAGEGDREGFRMLVDRGLGGNPQLLSGLKEVGRIMEHVWRERDGQAVTGEWNVARCLGVLGRPALLV